MSERSERLFRVMSEIDEETIDEAAPGDRVRRATPRGWGPLHPFPWKWGAIAAAIALVVGLGSYILPRLGGNLSSTGTPGGDAGTNEASTFMSYAGPVFPLTLKEADSAITAEREITLDFAPWVPLKEGGYQRYSTDILVTDAFTLTNASDEDREVTLLYPFVASLYDLTKRMPTLTADGATLETTLHAGAYSGGFMGGLGGDLLTETESGSLNLDQLNSWEEYKALLSDGRYLEDALGPYPDLSGIGAIVYEFTDPWGDDVGPNPTIGVEFNLDYDKTTVLSEGFNGGSWNPETGWMYQEFSIPKPGWSDYDKACYLIVIGEDIRNVETHGYTTGGGWDDPPTIEAGVTVTRYETDLDTVLRKVAGQMFQTWGRNREDVERVDFELYYGLFCGYLATYGVLSDRPMARYSNGWLWDMDFDAVDRVFYLETTVTVPAGGSVEVTAAMTKEGSYDFYGARGEQRGVSGYDMVTTLGSNLACTAQTALLEDRGQIQIVRQNFGFDLEKGVNRVPLDPKQEHYYLEVKGREDRFTK